MAKSMLSMWKINLDLWKTEDFEPSFTRENKYTVSNVSKEEMLLNLKMFYFQNIKEKFNLNA